MLATVIPIQTAVIIIQTTTIMILTTAVTDVAIDLNQAAALVIDVDVVAADAVAVVLTSVEVSAEDSGNRLKAALKREQKDFLLQLSFLLNIINWQLHKFFH